MAPTHETWFVHHAADYPLDWGALGRPSVVVGLVAVLLVAVVWRVAARHVPAPELAPLSPLGRFAVWVPRLLALHLGVSLLLLAFDRMVLAPTVTAPDGWRGTALLLPEAVVGVLLVIGRQVPLAAAAVVAAGPVVWGLAGTEALLSCLVLVGISGFLVLLPPDPALGGRAKLTPDALRPAVLVLRLGTAGSLLTLAVVEKLANPAMAHAMLDQKPVLDVLSPFGVGPDAFATFAGCVEVLFALLVLSGATPQVVSLVAAVPFSATLLVFGGTELVGHLPVYGVLLTLLLLGSRNDTSHEVSRLREPAAAT
jgi:uncharacterized membrane protein YphA (DoxX/SURF4 family)